MIDFHQVMQRVKLVLSTKINKNKIYDKDIAIALHINPQNYAVIKRRTKIPFEEIAYFSKKHHINMTWLLFGQAPKHLKPLD